MSRPWRTDGRKTEDGKWKIEQCSVRPETAIIVVTMDTIIITIIVVTIIINIIILIIITYIIIVPPGSSAQQRLARNATTLNLRLAGLSQERWVRYTLITRHTRADCSFIIQFNFSRSCVFILSLIVDVGRFQEMSAKRSQPRPALLSAMR